MIDPRLDILPIRDVQTVYRFNGFNGFPPLAAAWLFRRCHGARFLLAPQKALSCAAELQTAEFGSHG